MKKYTHEDILRHVLHLPPPLDLTNKTELRETLEGMPPALDRFDRMLDGLEMALDFLLRIEDDPADEALKESIVLREAVPVRPRWKVYGEFKRLPVRTCSERSVDDLRRVLEDWVVAPDPSVLLAPFWKLWLGENYHKAKWGALHYLRMHLRGRAEHPAARRLVDIAARHWARQPRHISGTLVSDAAHVAGPGAFGLLDAVIEAPPGQPPFIDEPESENITFRENFRDLKHYEMEKLGLVPPRPPPPEDEDEDEDEDDF